MEHDTRRYYAVSIGRKPGIYRTWTEAEKQVHGYPKAIHQSFPTREEAEAFMMDMHLDEYRAHCRTHQLPIPSRR